MQFPSTCISSSRGRYFFFYFFTFSLYSFFFCSRQGGRGWGIRAKNTGGTSNWKHLIAFSLFLSFCFFKSIYFDAQKLNLCFVLICTQSSYVESKETLLFFFETSQFTKYFFHMALQSLQGSKLITMRYKSRAFRFFDFFCFLSVYVFFHFFLRSFDRFGIFVGRNFNNQKANSCSFLHFSSVSCQYVPSFKEKLKEKLSVLISLGQNQGDERNLVSRQPFEKPKYSSRVQVGLQPKFNCNINTLLF